MSIFTRIFYILYNALWLIAKLVLRFNKRLQDGFEQRLIPDDWLKQKLLPEGNLYTSIEKNKYIYCSICQNSSTNSECISEEDVHYIKDFQIDGIDLWLQAASGGEAYLVADFLKALPKNQMKLNILITTWTSQGMEILEKECAKIYQNWKKEDDKTALPIILIRFICFDSGKIVKKAFDLAKPKLCILFETELWPNFMLECTNRKVPLYVINARMTKTSYEFYKIMKFVLNEISPKEVLATTKNDMERFSKIFPASLVSFMPNMKFDRAIDLVQQRKNVSLPKSISSLKNDFEHENEFNHSSQIEDNHEITQSGQLLKFSFEKSNPASFKINMKNKKTRKFSLKKNRLFFSSRKVNKKEDEVLSSKKYLEFLPEFFSKASSVILFASLRKKEENLLSALLWKVFSHKQKSIFIIVPKHLERAEHWYARFYDLGMNPVLASEYFKLQNYEDGQIKPFEVHQCIVWDIFGDLAKLYTEADFAFVGGSFKNLGGQNFLEALATGICPHVGPDIDNFLWALGDDNPPSLLDKKYLIQHNNVRELKSSLFGHKEVRKSVQSREEVQQEVLAWLEKYSGSSKLVVERILNDSIFSK